MEAFNVVLDALRAFAQTAAAFIPKLALALLIALAGWAAAKVLRFALIKALRSINFHILTERSGVDAFLQMGGAHTDTTDVLGLLVYWLVIVAGLLLACNTLGLGYVTELLARLALFVPRLMFGLVILAFGAYFARFVGGSLTTYARQVGLDEAPLLGRLARWCVLLFVILIALDQLDIGGSIIRQSFLILLSGLVLALALAFGYGGRHWAERLLHHWMPTDGPSAKPPGIDRPRQP